MPTPATIAAVTAKLDAPTGAEPAPNNATVDASPAGGAALGAGSAPADATTPTAVDSAGASPAAATTPAIDHEELAAKLQRDRELRAAREEKKRARQSADAADAARKEAEAARAKWAELGKNGSILDALKEAGRDPSEVFQKLREEALKAGTPEAQIEKITKAYDGELAKIRDELKAEREAREAEKKQREEEEQQHAAQRAAYAFRMDFENATKVEEFASLLDEYERPQLFAIAQAMANDPDRLAAQAQLLQLNMPNLTAPDGRFNMKDIFRVLKATQDEHYARKQRRTQSAAPQPSTPSPTQPAAVTKPTVNGTAERKPPTTIGNDIASSSASETEQLKNMTFEQRKAYLAKKYA